MTNSSNPARQADESNVVRRQFLRSVGAAAGGGVLAGPVAATAEEGDSSRSACPQETTTSLSGHVSRGERWTHSHELDERVCDVRIRVGPAGDAAVDLDLYVTLDGRTPGADDYDRTSAGSDAGERVVLGNEATRGAPALGIAVESYSGSGSFDLDVVESRERAPAPLLTPAVSTGGVTGVTATTAVLHGTLEETGVTGEVDVSFEYRQAGAGNSWKTTSEETMTSTGSFSHAVSGLEPTTEYEYRARAVGVVVPVRGSTRTFTTNDGSCFITTATHREGATLDSLRRFRDESMAATPVGRGLVGLYYRISPPIARTLDRHPESRTAAAVRKLVRTCASLSDRQDRTGSRAERAALGVWLTVLYAVGIAVGAAGHAGITAQELLDRD